MLVSSLIFSGLHVSNGGFNLLGGLNIFLVGLVLCIYMMKRGSIWGACAIHSMWNFAQGCIFRFPVSGINVGCSVIDVKAEAHRSAITGGEFGPEASICATVVLLAALGIVLALKARDPAPEPKPEAPDRPE